MLFRSQLEFTQIDIEASFITREDIIGLAERLMQALWAEAGIAVTTPFPRMSYAEAMERYGCDRPDLRYGLAIEDLTPHVSGSESGIIQSAIAAGGRVRGIRVPGGAAWSRKQVDELEAIAKAAQEVRVTEEVAGVLGELRAWLAGERTYVSDRRWVKITWLLKVASAAEGRQAVAVWDLWLLPW